MFIRRFYSLQDQRSSAIAIVIRVIRSLAGVIVVLMTVAPQPSFAIEPQDGAIAVVERKPVATSRRPNPDLLNLPVGRWVKVHEQRPDDEVTFKRQAHAGSAFDSRRGRIVIFGSDTHGEDWSNSPLFFDIASLRWSRLYPDDDPSTYRVNAEGIPVAGTYEDHPWAMHTFGSVEYDPISDSLIVSSYPQHLEPGRFTDVVAKMWPQIRRHPTWKLDLTSGRWQPLPGQAVHFFAYATAYDSDRRLIIGYRNNGIFELNLHSGQWKRIMSGGLLGYHNNAVYDSWDKALVVFGSNENSNDVIVYKPETAQHLKMPTAGQRPPRGQHAPMAFHQRLGKTVVVVDRTPDDRPVHDLRETQAETWLYDLDKDAWAQVTSATLPFGCGMNYNMEYDTADDLLFLVAGVPNEPTTVWALRL
jgi:hypothetical protein